MLWRQLTAATARPTAPRALSTSAHRLSQLAPLTLTLRTPFGPYTETHDVPTPVVHAVEKLGPSAAWSDVQTVLASGKFESMGALARAFEERAAIKEVQDSLDWERELGATVAALALHASTDLQKVDDLKRHDQYAAAVRKLNEAKDEFNFSKWWAVWKKALQNERDLFWEKLFAAIEPTKEQREHLVYFAMGGRSNMVHLAHHHLEDVFDVSILTPTQLSQLRAYLTHHGALIIGIEQGLYARFRSMMSLENREQLVDILGKDERELVRELYYTAMEETPRVTGEGSRQELLEQLVAAYARL